jgi:UDPglucose 6-dehydrogenase
LISPTKTSVCVIGIWHLGSVYSSCIAELGYNVIGVDTDACKVKNLNRGIPPLFEPNLAELINKNVLAGRLCFTSDYSEAVSKARFIFITFDTKVDDEDVVNLTEVYSTALHLAKYIQGGSTIIVSSQVPVGTCEKLSYMIKKQNPSADFKLAYVPENLRLGQAIDRFMHPERIVIGADEKETQDIVEEFFSIITDPKLKMSLRSAEMAKHALNVYLATTISFGNEIANLCDETGADALQVAEALRLDSRIGKKAMIKPGLGFAGGTLARDLKVLQKLGQTTNCKTPLVNAVLEVNYKQNQLVAEKLKKIYGSIENLTVAVFGLTYKAGTSTLRRSSALEIIRSLSSEGAKIKAYDPKADLREVAEQFTFEFFTEPFEAAKNADALIFVTDWPEFRKLDFLSLKAVMNKPVIIDAQNMLDANFLSEIGFTYLGVGRGQKLTQSVFA